jgi:hypothetical protein
MKNEDLVFTKGTKNAGYQWIGYKTHPPKSYYIKMTMKIKFIGKVPKPTNANWGIKIHGNAMNDWTKGLKPNTWNTVSRMSRATGGDQGINLLIFD